MAVTINGSRLRAWEAVVPASYRHRIEEARRTLEGSGAIVALGFAFDAPLLAAAIMQARARLHRGEWWGSGPELEWLQRSGIASTEALWVVIVALADAGHIQVAFTRGGGIMLRVTETGVVALDYAISGAATFLHRFSDDPEHFKLACPDVGPANPSRAYNPAFSPA